MIIVIPLGFCAATVAGAGLALMVVSLHSASQRGERVWGRFWAPREMFVGIELALNRVGFLPFWLARHNKLIFGSLFVAGLAYAAVEWFRRGGGA